MQVPLANCYFSGSTTGDYSFKNGYKVIGQQMPLFLGEQELSLCYRHPIQDVINILKKERTIGVISDIFMPIGDWPNRSNIKEMLNIFCSLLTFTCDTRINWFGYEIHNSNREIIYRYLVQTSAIGFYGDIAGANWSPLPWIIENDSLPLFLHEAYDKYQQLWDNWDIYALINLFTELRVHHRYLEITGLHFSACAELIYRAYRSQHGNCKIENALNNICKCIGFDVTSDEVMRFLKNRHALVHEGVFEISDCVITPDKRSALPPRKKWAWYDMKIEERDQELHFMEDFIGTLILNMLGIKKKLNGW